MAAVDELHRLCELVRDLAPEQRRARLLAEGASADVVAAVEAWIAAADGRSTPPLAPRAEPPETELGDGDVLGAWRLRRRLGSGGMGAVYLAARADGHFQQQAAIKLIRGLGSRDTFAHFTRERQILATLQHPHIARLLDGGATPRGQPYLVMEYVEGVPIDVYCDACKLDLGARLGLFRTVCAAVQFAHQRLIVHCDLKPSNVLVRADGTPVLLDFGIARMLDQPVAAASETAYFTPSHASPEQLRGEAVTTASDVYALGLILFELVSGHKARAGSDDRTVTLFTQAAIRPSQLATDVPWRQRIAGDLDAVVLHATADEPGARYASASALAEDIGRFLEYRPVRARAQTLAYRGTRLLRRRWPVFAAAVLACLLAALFTWRLAAERDRAQTAEHEAQVQATTAMRVSAFTLSVFDGANPDNNGGRRDVSARDLLDTAAARIDHELADEPRVRGRMLATLGTAYRYIGQPNAAIDLLNRAAKLYLGPAVAQPLDAADALSQVAVLYANNAYPAALAESTARRAMALRVPRVAADSLASADSLNTLGVVLDSEGKFDEAEHDLQRALAIRTAREGAQSASVASVLHNLGLVMMNRGAAKEATPYFERALAIKRVLHGEQSPQYEFTLRLLASAVSKGGDRARGIELFRQHLALCEKLFGNDSVLLGDAHNEFASALQDAGQYAQAGEHYQQALQIDARASGDDSANYARALNNLASLREDMGDPAAAEPLLRRSLALRRKLYPADDLNVARAQHNLARVLIEQDKLDEAKPLLDAALATRMRKLAPDHADIVRTQLQQAEYLRRRGALDGLRAALGQLDHAPATFTPLMTARRCELQAVVDAAAHDNDAVLRDREQAWDAMRSSFGAAHPASAMFALDYAQSLADAGQLAVAQAIVAPLRAVIATNFVATAPIRERLARWH